VTSDVGQGHCHHSLLLHYTASLQTRDVLLLALFWNLRALQTATTCWTCITLLTC
jgi:hypothetical protein